jgi:hypothetical protein
MTSSMPGRLAVTSRHPSSGRSPCRARRGEVVNRTGEAEGRSARADPGHPQKPLSPIESCSSQNVRLLLRRTSTHYPWTWWFLTKTSCRKRGFNYVTVALIDLRESHFVASDLAFSVDLGSHDANRHVVVGALFRVCRG